MDITAVSIFVVIFVELINSIFLHSTNIITNIETPVLSTQIMEDLDKQQNKST